MGYVIFAVLAVAEIALTVNSVVKRKKDRKLRAYVAIGLSALWLVLTLTGVIKQGFQYVIIEIILFIKCLVGIIALMRNREEKERKPVGMIIGAAFTIIGYMIAVVPAILFPQHEAIPTTGQYEVASTHVTYVDETRTNPYIATQDPRAVAAMVWYPNADVTECPLVVFSHGFNGVSISNVSLFEELAGNGYVVVSLEHPEMSFYSFDDRTKKVATIAPQYMEEYQIADTTTDLSVTYEYIHKWTEIREADMNFMIDQIFEECDKADGAEWAKKIDKENLIAMGHSAGGSAAYGLGRSRDDIKAVVALEAPYFSDIIGVNKETNEFIWEEETYPVPVLNVYSDCVWQQWDKSPVYQENVLAMEGKAGETRNIHIENAGHLELTDLSIFSPFLTKAMDDSYVGTSSREGLETLNREVLPFVNYFVKNVGEKPDMK